MMIGGFNLTKFLFGKKGGLTYSEMENAATRVPFSDYLPHIAYKEDLNMYTTVDNCGGFIFECYPLNFASDGVVHTLDGILGMSLPEDSVIQFILHADNNISFILDEYKRLKTRPDPVIKKQADAYADFLYQSRNGFEKMSGVPLRNFRLFVTVKVPLDDDFNVKGDLSAFDIFTTVQESLRGAYLYPRVMTPDLLLDWLRRIFNVEVSNSFLYNDDIPIRKQAINAETEILAHNKYLEIGGRQFRAMTPKSCPKNFSLASIANLTGGVLGQSDDGNQVRTQYLITINVIIQNLRTALHQKTNAVLAQKPAGSFSPSIKNKQEEYLKATSDLDKNVRFLRVLPEVWVWGTPDQSLESVSRTKRLWDSYGFIMQEDRGMLAPLFITALPLGLYLEGKTLQKLERDFIAPSTTIAAMMPIQSDFTGGGNPVSLYVGRKGQLATLDLFNKIATNHNFFGVGEAGQGKTTGLIKLIYDHYSTGVMARHIEIGEGFKRICQSVNGRHIIFDQRSRISLNPFSTAATIDIDSDKEEANYLVSTIAAIIRQMTTSSTDVIDDASAELYASLVRMAVRWALSVAQNKADIDLVQTFLKEFPKHATDEFDFCTDDECTSKFKMLARQLAVMLSPFTSEGEYGRWFNGQATLDLSSDQFVVIELEHIRNQQELFKVVVVQLLNLITSEMYLAERGPKRLFTIDEAHLILPDITRSGGTSVVEKTTSAVVEEAYRRCRKHGTGMGVITQSPTDLPRWGSVGSVILGNSPFRFFYSSPDIEKAQFEHAIDYDKFTLDMIKTVRSKRMSYSEFFCDTPFGKGVLRNLFDPYWYWMTTSAASEVGRIDRMVKELGITYVDAIDRIIKEDEGINSRRN